MPLWYIGLSPMNPYLDHDRTSLERELANLAQVMNAHRAYDAALARARANAVFFATIAPLDDAVDTLKALLHDELGVAERLLNEAVDQLDARAERRHARSARPIVI